jgi:hypothetical protein
MEPKVYSSSTLTDPVLSGVNYFDILTYCIFKIGLNIIIYSSVLSEHLLGETEENLSQDGQSPGRDLSPGHPKYDHDIQWWWRTEENLLLPGL